ncbi:ATP-dependent RNA helicase NAM7 [Lachancea thermotolerans CBS 6340]|uniref:KLTH0D05786p n=1 Tax=Lachancea thermotolerans (strain ATCC 56472 / CBS 6340 / NRRL Y-8284) TaxID=559295 RepID=C5DGJ4_LACTC|nr:KLTH0D05786p [Lachancea thermotolerans CBS 6340]CAR22536.1 KLTH0D05786p [Lachancea thermotolerans CBS 6340]
MSPAAGPSVTPDAEDKTVKPVSEAGSEAAVTAEMNELYVSNSEIAAVMPGENEDFGEPMEAPPSEFACAYCNVDSAKCVVKCNTCNKWFCNSKNGTSSSHIINHLVLSHHNTVSLHPESDLGDTVLECYNCGCKNVFVLGFVSAKSEAVVVILCRLPCAQTKTVSWDTDQWQSLIENRQFLSWVAEDPSDEELLRARMISPSQISKLEAKWRSNKDATINDIEVPDEKEEVPHILMRYADAYQYQRSFAPLVKIEADYDKQLKESQALEHISVSWSLGLSNRHLASFALSTFESNGLKVAVGDEMILRYSGVQHPEWEGHGYIVRLPNSFQDQLTLELKPSKTPPPTSFNTGFTAEFVWKGTSYDRMQEAMKKFAVVKKSVSGFLYYKILGHEVPDLEFDVNLPEQFSIPHFTQLNVSQANAIRHVLQRPLSLIQGPPGTGKTVTSATIVYHLSKLHKERILVCAPSNVAVDHLAAKLRDLGLKVVRLTAKSREDVESSVSNLGLHNLVSRSAKGELKKLLKLKEDVGELSPSDAKKFVKQVRKSELEILKKADVVCCTCVGAGDKRLEAKFRTVLIDESTQASEPECLIPIVKGAKQVVLVGDHQQLGPVILDRKAADAGLKQSLFERLISLGHIPIRLEVQYRMNPHLSEFPSNMFYEGSLQNGVTIEQRSVTNSTFPWPIHDLPMMFWSNYGREEISGNGTSYLNRIEAMNCERVITKLFKDGVKPDQIGVITPYEGQRAYIVQYMQMNGSMDKELYMNVEVASVDAFQGREKDYIILSCVRANEQQAIGFLSDPRRLNVALTRSKYGLVILGNPRSLSRNSLWSHLLVYFREKGCLVEGALGNLQLCTVQLTKSRNVRPSQKTNFSKMEFSHGAEMGQTNFNDFDTQSLMSYGGIDTFGMAGNSNLNALFNNFHPFGQHPQQLNTADTNTFDGYLKFDSSLARGLQAYGGSASKYEGAVKGNGDSRKVPDDAVRELNV